MTSLIIGVKLVKNPENPSCKRQLNALIKHNVTNFTIINNELGTVIFNWYNLYLTLLINFWSFYA